MKILKSDCDLKNLEFHNVAEFREHNGLPGLGMCRYPAKVRKVMTEHGKLMAIESVGCEIRFFTESQNVRVYLYAVSGNPVVWVYRGDIWNATFHLEQGKISCLSVAKPDFSKFKEEYLNKGAFSPNIWRFIIGGGHVAFCSVESFGYPLRPPKISEKPKKKWLAYGSSITHADLYGYIHTAARILGVDLLNKGMSGSCFCEKETADYLADECEWDFATLELGVNMRNTVEPAEFTERAEYIVDKFTSKKNADKPVILISIFPNGNDALKIPDKVSETQNKYRKILRDLASKMKSRNVHLIEGNTILDDFTMLAADLVHPTHPGHALMGYNLAKTLRKIIGG